MGQAEKTRGDFLEFSHDIAPRNGTEATSAACGQGKFGTNAKAEALLSNA
jgi:hypothetical protein